MPKKMLPPKGVYPFFIIFLGVLNVGWGWGGGEGVKDQRTKFQI